jgi:hypothetical protein
MNGNVGDGLMEMLKMVQWECLRWSNESDLEVCIGELEVHGIYIEIEKWGSVRIKYEFMSVRFNSMSNEKV